MHADCSQLDQLVELIEYAHSQSDRSYTPFRADKTRAILKQGILNPKWLVLTNKQVSAVYVMCLAPTLWCDLESAMDLFLYAKDNNGAGVRLLKESKQWIDGFTNLYSAHASTSDNNKEVDKMYKRLGYKQIGSVFELRSSV